MRRRLRDHFGGDLDDLPIVSRDLAAWDRPNFQAAVDAWSAGREVEGDEGAPLTVRTLPKISRDRIVLPPGVVERIERQARAFEELRHSTHDLTNALLGARPPTEDFDVS